MEFKNRPVKDGLFVSLSRAVYCTITLSGVPDTPAKQGVSAVRERDTPKCLSEHIIS